MKASRLRIIGLALVIAVIAVVGGLKFMEASKPAPAAAPQQVTGYLGGEKISLFDDAEFKKLGEDAGLEIDYRKAGSLDMMTASPEGMDYLFPSSRAAVAYGKAKGVDTSKSDIVFNSPIVIYTHKPVADALVASGIMSRDGSGVYRMDMAKAADAMLADKTWADLGWTGGYGQFRIDSTDPTKSNSGNEYAALLATVLNGGTPATVESVARDADKIKHIFDKSGFMETSSEDSFSQFLTLGVGSKPAMIGYESQILDLAVNQKDTYDQVKDDLVMVYPTPTVWSTHVLIPLDAKGEQLLGVLKSDAVQKLAWTKHGFRMANFMGATKVSEFGVPGVQESVTMVSELPDNDAMQELIATLGG